MPPFRTMTPPLSSVIKTPQIWQSIIQPSGVLDRRATYSTQSLESNEEIYDIYNNTQLVGTRVWSSNGRGYIECTNEKFQQ